MVERGHGYHRYTAALDGDDEDKDQIDLVLSDLGIESVLAQGPQGVQGGRDSSGGGAGWEDEAKRGNVGKRGTRGEGNASAASEETIKVKQMLQVAHREERFHEAEQLSLALDRVKSLGVKLYWARRAQESASRREEFDEAKRHRDEAREAEAWLRQTVSDALRNCLFQALREDGREEDDPATNRTRDNEKRLMSGENATLRKEERSAKGGLASASRSSVTKKAAESAASHEAETGRRTSSEENDSEDKAVEGRSAPELAKRSPFDQRQKGDGSKDGNRNKHPTSRPPWLTPSCPTSTKPWQGALLNLPWPAGVQPDFRTVFSHEWTGGRREPGDLAWPMSSETIVLPVTTKDNNNREHASALRALDSKLGGGGESGGLLSKDPIESSGLLRTILRLVAASQDLRPPGPVPPDLAPFRRAGRADGLPPLCTFSCRLAEGEGPDAGVGNLSGSEKKKAKKGNRNDAINSSQQPVERDVRDAQGDRNQTLDETDGRQTDERREAARDRNQRCVGRAFAHPAADVTPSATHVINWIEDNPVVAWGDVAVSAALRRNRHQRERDTASSQNRQCHSASSGEKTSSNTRKSAIKGTKAHRRDTPHKREVKPGYDDVGGEGTGESGVRETGARTPTRSTKRDESQGAEISSEEGVEPAEAPAASTNESGSSVGALAAAPTPRPAVLPDIVGAGGFTEFIPLLEIIIGR
ncbi:unnamed protein product, partial [Ectocarpus sp. 13 AM-2016]